MIGKIAPSVKVIQLTNGKHALDFLNTNYSTTNRYVVLLDINMPVMNGWQFLEAFESISLSKKDNVTIHVVSSSTDHDDKSRALSHASVTEFISKPLSIALLKHLLL